MTDLKGLTNSLSPLISLAKEVHDSFNSSLVLFGENAADAVLPLFKTLLVTYENYVSVEFDGDVVSSDNLQEIADIVGPVEWKITVGKSPFKTTKSGLLQIVFFTTNGYVDWCQSILGLQPLSPHIENAVVISVAGIGCSFGGKFITVRDLAEDVPEVSQDTAKPYLPTSEQVHCLIHVVSDKILKIDPRFFDLSWGELESPLAQPLKRVFVTHLAASLAQDIYLKNGELHAVLKGTKRLELPLWSVDYDNFAPAMIAHLREAVSWIYDERAETRLRLVSDRLSIDIPPQQSLVIGALNNISDAVKQARDRYGFVIMERKDAYYKELRDLLKDVRSQADLYAAKVRDLVTSLQRDVLAMLVLLGFTLLPKINQAHDSLIAPSFEMVVFFRILAGYFIVSFVLQASSHCRDLSLSYKEGHDWLTLIHDYTSQKELDDNFEKPIERRKMTFYISLTVSFVCYVGLALTTWYFFELYDLLQYLFSLPER